VQTKEVLLMYLDGADHRYITSLDSRLLYQLMFTPGHRYNTSRFKMTISADVNPWGDISLLTAPPPTTSGVKSY
jgi:hypothetical protein